MHKDTSSGGSDGHVEDADDPGDDGGVTRRRLVASGAATWATVSLAGCRYITDPGTGDDDDDATPTPTVTTETTTTDEPVGPGTDDGTDDGTPTDTPTPSPSPTAPPTTACANIDRFFAGMEVGLHVTVHDPRTGDVLGGDAIDAVTVEFPNADFGPLELNWEGAHENYSPDTWGSKVVTDPDAEPGTYEYEVTVSGDAVDVEGTITDRFTIV